MFPFCIPLRCEQRQSLASLFTTMLSYHIIAKTFGEPFLQHVVRHQILVLYFVNLQPALYRPSDQRATRGLGHEGECNENPLALSSILLTSRPRPARTSGALEELQLMKPSRMLVPNDCSYFVGVWGAQREPKYSPFFDLVLVVVQALSCVCTFFSSACTLNDFCVFSYLHPL